MKCPVCGGEIAEASFCASCSSGSPPPVTSDTLRIHLQRAIDDEYNLVRLLGRGGMGAVYLARELALDRLVGIKVLPPEGSDDPERRIRFRREAQLAAQLSHPNIVPLHRFGEKDGLSYYVMGFVRGESVADRLRRDGRIRPDEARLLLAQLADALEYAHGKGVIHRDIKPDNILLDDETARPMLADFGIARRTGDGGIHTDARSIEGTLHFMSPEQAVGAAPDTRSDIYSLGVVGYVMLAGETPFSAGTLAELARAQTAADPPHLSARVPDVPSDLSAAIARALAREPDRRWPHARAFKDALGAPLDEDPDRLPGELRELSGSIFYAVVVGWLAANLVLLLVPPPLRVPFTWGAALAVALSFAATAVIHQRKGFSWSEIARVALWPPGWWPFWWPRGHRRPWDLWDRLPLTVRRLRIAYGLAVLALVVGVPLTLHADTRIPLLAVLGSGQLIVTFLMLFTAWWAYRRGIPNNADLRSLVLRSSADRRFWKRPQLAQRLLPDSAHARAPSALTPAEYVRQMSESALRMRGRARDTGVEAVAVARSTCSTLIDIDASLAASQQESDHPGRQHLRHQHLRLTSALEALWQHQLRVERDESGDAIQDLARHTALLSMELRGAAAGSDPGGSPTISDSGGAA